MGERSIIANIRAKTDSSTPGVYVHWMGTPSEVASLVAYCRMQDFRGFQYDYMAARLAQVACNCEDSKLSVGTGPVSGLAMSDYGTWYVDDEWNIVENSEGLSIPKPDLTTVLMINSQQPEWLKMDRCDIVDALMQMEGWE